MYGNNASALLQSPCRGHYEYHTSQRNVSKFLRSLCLQNSCNSVKELSLIDEETIFESMKCEETVLEEARKSTVTLYIQMCIVISN